MKYKGWMIAGLLLLLGASPLWADSIDRAYESAAERYRELYRDTNFRDRADNWINTIKDFEEIVEKHPKHDKAPAALFSIGKLYGSLYKWNRQESYLDASMEAFRRLADDYSHDPLADDAQFFLAEHYELDKGSRTRAYLEYEKVVNKFPGGDFRNLAKDKLKELPPPPRKPDLAPPPPKTTAIAPDDLFTPRFGGLSEADQNKGDKKLVSRVEYWSNPDWSRMVINLKGPVRFKYQALPANEAQGKSERVYLDLYNAYLPNQFHKKIAAHDGLIQQARIAQFDKNTVRIVLDLESLKKIKVFQMGLPNQYKVIVDVLGSDDVQTLSPQTQPSSTPQVATQATTPIQVASQQTPATKPEHPLNPPQAHDPNAKASATTVPSLSQMLGLKVKRIILDPGHGGKDPGAIGFRLKEKDIALNIAKELKTIIETKHPGIEVLMTRETDIFLSLEARTAFANKNRGDLFVSIHLNASKKPAVSGIETYYLNLTADPEAMELAAKENATSLSGISDLQNILEDIMTNSKIRESNDLAQLVQASLHQDANQKNKIRNLGVKKAPFFVLLGAQMPSVLVETGFITNKEENKLLQSQTYQATLAQGIYKGLEEYMKATNTL